MTIGFDGRPVPSITLSDGTTKTTISCSEVPADTPEPAGDTITEACDRKCTTDADCATGFPEFNPCGYCQNWGESPSMECEGTAPPPTEGDDWNTAGPVVAPGDGAAAAAAKAAAGVDETSPSSTTGVGPCVKNPDGGTDC